MSKHSRNLLYEQVQGEDVIASYFQSSDALHLGSSFGIAVMVFYFTVQLAVQMRCSRGQERKVWFVWAALSLSLAFGTIHVLASPGDLGTNVLIRGLWPLGLSVAACMLGCSMTLYTVTKKRPGRLLEVISLLSLIVGFSCMHLLAPSMPPGSKDVGKVWVFAGSTAIAVFFFTVLRGALSRVHPGGIRTLVFGVIFALPACLIHFLTAANASIGVEPSHIFAAEAHWASHWEILAFLALVVMGFGIVASLISRQVYKQAVELKLKEERERISQVLYEQNVTRLNNEALTREIQERKKIEEQLIHVAYHDPLTGLYNRAYLTMWVRSLIEDPASTSRNKLALLHIDIDRFKAANDMLGTAAGDSLLQEVGRRLARCARERDVIARIGGDEFAVLLQDFSDVNQVVRVAQRILNNIEEPFPAEGLSFPISASIGIREFGLSSSDLDQFLSDADTAMHHAKKNGGSQVHVYHSSMRDQVLAEMQRKRQLQVAAEREEFELYYQPLVDARDRSIYGVEALIRWNHPVRGLVSPIEFIGLAEKTGQITVIGEWVLRRACLDFKKLHMNAKHDLLLSVNVSSVQFNDSMFLDVLRRVLSDTSMPAYLLQLEITESIFIEDADRIGRLFDEIRVMGIKIAFDDFGTGYSSLSYLERYPIDTLKIDQSFVRKMLNGTVNAEIVQLIIQLAQAVGMEVSAEGVEDSEQVAALVEYGCNIMQGYLYSKPITLIDMVELVHKGIPRRGNQLEVVRPHPMHSRLGGQ